MFTTLLLAVFSEAYAGTVVFQPPIDKGNSQKKITKDGITINTDKGYVNDVYETYRFYKRSVTTISSTVGNITKIEFSCTAYDNAQYGPGGWHLANDSLGRYSCRGKIGTWTGNATSIKMVASFNQVRATKIVVTYGSATNTKTTTTLTFDNTNNYIFAQGSGEHTFVNAASLAPVVTGATVSYSSDNENIATVDEHGKVVVGSDQSGTATITATYAGNSQYSGSKDSYTIKVEKKFQNIAELNQNMTPDKKVGLLKLTNAQFTYINGAYHYLQDAAGAVCVFNSDLKGYKTGQVLNGDAEVEYNLNDGMQEIRAITLRDGIKVTQDKVVPNEMSVTDAIIKNNLCKYIKLSGVTVSAQHVVDDASKIFLKDLFKKNLPIKQDGVYDLITIPILYNGTLQLAVISIQPLPIGLKVAIGETGYATLYDSVHALLVPAGVRASGYMLRNNKLVEGDVYKKGDVIPKDFAVVLKATPNTEYNFAISTKDGINKKANILMGTETITDLSINAADCFYYALTTNANNDINSVGYYWMRKDGAPFTNGAHKAYFKIAKTINAKMGYAFNEETTAIASIHASQPAKAPSLYNLSGQRVTPNYKGVVICNGKKIVLR